MNDSILVFKEGKAGLWSGGAKVVLFADPRDMVLKYLLCCLFIG